MGVTEDEVAGWHLQLNGQEFGQAPGDREGQGSLACCSSQAHEESDRAERLHNGNIPQNPPSRELGTQSVCGMNE